MGPQPATDKQLAYIKTLAQHRQIPNAAQTMIEASILERIADVKRQSPVSKAEASEAIDYLLQRPHVLAGVVETTPLTTALASLPVCKYMVDGAHGEAIIVEVVERKGGRRWLNRLLGAPGDWRRVRLPSPQMAHWAEKVKGAQYYDAPTDRALEGPEAAAVRFSREFVCCAACGSPLSDAESMARGLGPVCAGRF